MGKLSRWDKSSMNLHIDIDRVLRLYHYIKTSLALFEEYEGQL